MVKYSSICYYLKKYVLENILFQSITYVNIFLTGVYIASFFFFYIFLLFNKYCTYINFYDILQIRDYCFTQLYPHTNINVNFVMDFI